MNMKFELTVEVIHLYFQIQTILQRQLYHTVMRKGTI